MNVRCVDGLVPGMTETLYGDHKILDHLVQRISSILDAIKASTKEEIEGVMDLQRVYFLLGTLTSVGDKEIQFLTLSILLRIPMVLKHANSFSPAWFPDWCTWVAFNTLTKFPPEKERSLQFLDMMNERMGDDCLVYSWKCCCVISADDLSDNHCSGEMLLDLNLGTRTFTLSLEEVDLRVPFSTITYWNISLKTLEGSKTLHIEFKTKDSTSFSILKFGASVVEHDLLIKSLQAEDSAAVEDEDRNEFLDVKPNQELSFVQNVTVVLIDVEDSDPEQKHNIAETFSGLMFSPSPQSTLIDIKSEADTNNNKRKRPVTPEANSTNKQRKRCVASKADYNNNKRKRPVTPEANTTKKQRK